MSSRELHMVRCLFVANCLKVHAAGQHLPIMTLIVNISNLPSIVCLPSQCPNKLQLLVLIFLGGDFFLKRHDDALHNHLLSPVPEPGGSGQSSRRPRLGQSATRQLPTGFKNLPHIRPRKARGYVPGDCGRKRRLAVAVHGP
jgi:hypothetical protein